MESGQWLHCRDGKKGVEVLHTVYQYNHQSGTLHLPLQSGSCSPVAIKARHLDVLVPVELAGHASCKGRKRACMHDCVLRSGPELGRV